MIFQLLKRLEADLWFVLDGVWYGFECRIAESTHDSMVLHLKLSYRHHFKDFVKYFPSFLKDVPDQFSCKLNVYFPKKYSKELKCGSKIVFTTDTMPEITQENLQEVQMRLINLRGISPRHEKNWNNVTSYEFKSGFEHL